MAPLSGGYPWRASQSLSNDSEFVISAHSIGQHRFVASEDPPVAPLANSVPGLEAEVSETGWSFNCLKKPE